MSGNKKFVGKVIVTYAVYADNKEQAYELLYYNTEHPLFPDGTGACVDDEIVSIEEVADWQHLEK